MNSDPDFLCPACHTSEDRPTVVVNLGDGTRVRVHEDCHAEVVARDAQERRQHPITKSQAANEETMKTELKLPDGTTFCALPCPLCQSARLTSEMWCEDEGEIDAVSCLSCLCAAPARNWNNRTGIDSHSKETV